MVSRKRIVPPPPPSEPATRSTRVRLKAEELDVAPTEPVVPPQEDEEDLPELTAVRAPQHSTGRTPMREAARAEGNHTPARKRRRRSNVVEDPFYIPLDEIPPGLSYEWKRWSNVGEENPFYIAQMREQGWEAVDPKMHPNWVPPGYSQPHIIKGGQILMERPMELTREAMSEMRTLARRQIRDAESRLGKADSGELARERPQIVKEYMRPVISAED